MKYFMIFYNLLKNLSLLINLFRVIKWRFELNKNQDSRDLLDIKFR